MNTKEAIDECNRWFAYLEKNRIKSVRLQELARMARKGPEQALLAQKEVRKIDSSCNPVVYDGARLQDAVKQLIKEVIK